MKPPAKEPLIQISNLTSLLHLGSEILQNPIEKLHLLIFELVAFRSFQISRQCSDLGLHLDCSADELWFSFDGFFVWAFDLKVVVDWVCALKERKSCESSSEEWGMGESERCQLGTVGALSLSVVSSVSIVICNKALISTLGFTFATTLTSWHLLVTFCSLHVALWMRLFEHKPFDPRAVMGFGILNGISIGLLNLSLGFNSVGFYQVLFLVFRDSAFF